MPEERSPRILYIEDDAALARLLQKNLQRNGYNVDIAVDGEEGLVMAQTGLYDLVLADHNLPSRGGLEIIRILAGDQRAPSVIMLTGNGNEIVAVEALKLGAADYLVKDPQGLYRDLLPMVIGKVLVNRGMAREREQMLIALKKSEEQYRTMFDNALTGNFVATPDCRVILCNEAFARIMGFGSVAEVLAAASIDFFPCQQEKERCQAHLRQFKKIEFMEFEMKKRDRTPMVALGSIDGIFDQSGGLHLVRGYLLDITDKKRYLENMKLMNEQLANLAKELCLVNQDLESRVEDRTAALKKSHDEMKKVSFQLLWAEERERERIAGELHDHVGQSLLLANMKLSALKEAMSSGPDRMLAEEASTLLTCSIQDIRTLTVRTRPPILDTAGIETALEWLCSSMRDDYPVQISLSKDRKPKPLGAEERYLIYQAVRELLMNVVKHAHTDHAQLSLTVDHDLLVVQVKDDGVGFNLSEMRLKQQNCDGYGLYNVQQRIEHIGGKFTVKSAPQKGTAIKLTVPLAESPTVGGISGNHHTARR